MEHAVTTQQHVYSMFMHHAQAASLLPHTNLGHIINMIMDNKIIINIIMFNIII